MYTKPDRRAARDRRHRRVRRRVTGTADRPRLAVYRSLRHTVAQLIDDTSGTTLAASSTLDSGLRGKLKSTGSAEAAAAVGTAIAEAARKLNLSAVVFDRGGYLYHGRVKALADAARAAGLEF